jgi:effector-binding domain-containing protein
MIARAFAHNKLAALMLALILGAPFTIASGVAQQAAPASPGVSQTPPTPNAPATPPAAASAPNAPASTPPAAAPAANAPTATPPVAAPPAASTPSAPPADAGKPSDDTSTGQSLDMVTHPAAYVEGKAIWNEGFSALTGSFGQINAEMAKAGVKAAGRPIAVFVETDDAGFKYRAMIPIEKAPEGKTTLSEAVKLGQTPAGKAMKFEHRGSYEDIDSTYEAITAYLDEKGLEADNFFVEEYLNDVKTPDDPNLQVDIYVLLK